MEDTDEAYRSISCIVCAEWLLTAEVQLSTSVY